MGRSYLFCLNTSHVKVKLIYVCFLFISQMGLNKSHVKVKCRGLLRFLVTLGCLNTSHVKVKWPAHIYKVSYLVV